jgi:CO/xanthine dehydrogenase FAD-binding subunit
MVREFFRPFGVDEALELLSVPGALALAGGTWALAFEARDKPERVVDVSRALPRTLVRNGPALLIGACATFQELVESATVPAVVKTAAMSMANRNTRNRATVGGNLGANRPCAILVPILVALDTTVEFKERGAPAATMPLAEWLASPRGLIVCARVPLAAGNRAASLRASRTACDMATAVAACRYRLEGGTVSGLSVGVGGFGPRATLRPDIAALFEGEPLPAKADIEKAVAPLLSATGDPRGSAEYKRLRGAALVADALHAAEDLR